MSEEPPPQHDPHRPFEIFMPVDGRKPRLPKRFSWPVGLEQLSKPLSHIPQSDSIKVWFNDHPASDYTLTMEQIANRGLAYRILTVWYHYLRSGSGWFLMVYPVEASQRQAVNGVLLESAFPAMDEWLCAPKTPVWLGSSHHLDCIYDPVVQSIRVVERPS